MLDLHGEGYWTHPLSLVESNQIGEGSRIWAWAHVSPKVVIGKDANICEHTFIEEGVHLGDRVTVKCGVYLWAGVTVEDDVFIGPNATFSNDHFPRSRAWKEPKKTLLKEGCSIGANATILGGTEIGRNAMVGAGAVVIESVPDNVTVAGNPARVVGRVHDG